MNEIKISPHTTANEIAYLDGLLNGGHCKHNTNFLDLSKEKGISLIKRWIKVAREREWGPGIDIDKCIQHAEMLLKNTVVS